MLKHRIFLALTAAEVALLVLLVAVGRDTARRASAADIPAKRAIARRLGLTDLSLWTEARYTRHPSQADLFSAFQDSPSSLEHFPAGSVVVAPPGLEAFERHPDHGSEGPEPCAD